MVHLAIDGNQTLVVTDTDYIGRTTSKYITTAMTAPGEKLKILSLYLWQELTNGNGEYTVNVTDVIANLSYS
jgi:hypothetical protein